MTDEELLERAQGLLVEHQRTCRSFRAVPRRGYLTALISTVCPSILAWLFAL